MVNSNDLKEMMDNEGYKRKMNKILQIAYKRERMKQKDSDMKILTLDTTNMSREELEIAFAMKVVVKKRYAK